MASINNSTLYPPIMDTYQLPVVMQKFDGVPVNFTISNYTDISTIKEIQFIVKTQNGANNVLTNSGIYFYPVKGDELSSRNLTIKIPKENFIDKGKDLRIDEFYRIQIRFSKRAYSSSLDKSEDNYLNKYVDSFSEWSAISLFKIIPSSSIMLEQNNFGIKNQMNYISSFDEISGMLTFTGDTSEYLHNYRVRVFENEERLSIDKLLLKNPIEDSGFISASVYNKNYFYYLFKYDFSRGVNYTCILDYETNNGYKDYLDFLFRISDSSIDPLISKYINNDNVIFNKDKGCNLVHISFNGNYNGKIVLRRTDSRSNYKKFEDIYVKELKTEDGDSLSWEDYTVESGVFYRYAIQEKDAHNNRSAKWFLNKDEESGEPKSTYVEFEDIFLIDKDNVLKVKFDPSISGYRKVVKDGLVETIGSQYPFLTRGAATNYRTFGLNGTIAWDSDVFEDLIGGPPYMQHNGEESFISDTDVDMTKHLFANLVNLFSYEEIAQEYKNFKTDYNRHRDYTIEKLFREMVLNYLNNGKPKLYKSLTEGNIIIKLTDVSLEPKIELGRLIYSFSCTATEIDENTIDNYKLYDIIYFSEENEESSETFLKRIVGELVIPFNTISKTIDLYEIIDKKYRYSQDGSIYYLKNIDNLILSLEEPTAPTIEGDHPLYADRTFKIILNGKEFYCFGKFETGNIEIESLEIESNDNEALASNNLIIQYTGNYMRAPYFVEKETTNRITQLGQLEKTIDGNTSLVQLLKDKYNYLDDKFKRTFISLNRAFVKIKNEWNPYLLPSFDIITYDKENDEENTSYSYNSVFNQFEQFIDLYDENFLIKDIIYKGVRIGFPSDFIDTTYSNKYYLDIDVSQLIEGTIYTAKDFVVEQKNPPEPDSQGYTEYAVYDEQDSSLYHKDSNEDNISYSRGEWYFAHAKEKYYTLINDALYEIIDIEYNEDDDIYIGYINIPLDIVFTYVYELERSIKNG